MTSTPVISKLLTISKFTTRTLQTISLIYDKVEEKLNILRDFLFHRTNFRYINDDSVSFRSYTAEPKLSALIKKSTFQSTSFPNEFPLAWDFFFFIFHKKYQAYPNSQSWFTFFVRSSP